MVTFVPICDQVTKPTTNSMAGKELTKTTSSDEIEIRLALNLREARTAGTVFAKAFENDEYWQWIYTPHRQQAKGKQKEAILQEGLKQSRRTIKNYFMNPKAYVLLASDVEANTPAGFAVWLAPTTRSAKVYERHVPLRYKLLKGILTVYHNLVNRLATWKLQWLLLYPTLGVSVLQRQRMWAEHTAILEERYISNRNRAQGYWQLSLLGVHPAFGGKGIAKQLLKWGTDKADEQDVACYLSASPKGLPVYQKVGFEVVGADFCYPEDPQGGWTETFMVREPFSERKMQKNQ